jgi:hypothetical protein
MRRSVLDAVASPNGQVHASKPTGNAVGANPYLVIRAIERSDLTAAEKGAVLVIADRAGNGRSVCTASYSTLAEMMHTVRRMAIRLVQRLAQKKWITIERTHLSKGDHGPNNLRMGPGFTKAIKAQARWEEEQKKRLLQRFRVMRKPSMGGGDQSVTRGIYDNCRGGGDQSVTRVVTNRSPRGDQSVTLTSPLTSPLTSSSSSTPPPRGRKDDDDVRFASQKSGGSKQQAKPLSDEEGREMVRRVASQCPHLPGASAKFQAATDLPYRCEHDWRGLARQVVRLEELVAAGDIKFRRIDNLVGYVVGMLKKLRSTKLPAGKLDALDAKVERLLKRASPSCPRQEPAPQPRPDHAAAELEASLPGLEADVASAPNRTAKQFAQRALDRAREDLAALKTEGRAAP